MENENLNWNKIAALLASRKVVPSTRVWDLIQERLPKHVAQRRFRIRTLLGIAATFSLMVSLTSLWALQNKSPESRFSGYKFAVRSNDAESAAIRSSVAFALKLYAADFPLDEHPSR